jgi:hypothetical protein
VGTDTFGDDATPVAAGRQGRGAGDASGAASGHGRRRDHTSQREAVAAGPVKMSGDVAVKC